MNIFEFAKQKENYSEQFYRDLAQKTSHKGLENIFSMLASEEAKHFRVIEKMQSENPHKVTDTQVLEDAKKIFEKMKGSAENFNVDLDQPQLYEKARDIEKQSKEFYLQKAQQTENPNHRNIFKKLADEEQKHYVIIDNIADFVSRPQTYLEDAEFYHFDDYVGGVF